MPNNWRWMKSKVLVWTGGGGGDRAQSPDQPRHQVGTPGSPEAAYA